jgi:transposase
VVYTTRCAEVSHVCCYHCYCYYRSRSTLRLLLLLPIPFYSSSATATTDPVLLFVGADVAALSVTVAWQRSSQGSGKDPQQCSSLEPMRPFTIEQSPIGFALLQKRLAATAATGIAAQQTLVVLEATSTYWIRFATTLHAAGYRVSVINPKQAHDFANDFANDFAKALLQRAKSQEPRPTPLTPRCWLNWALSLTRRLGHAPWTPPPDIYYQLHQRLAQRDSLLMLRPAPAPADPQPASRATP